LSKIINVFIISNKCCSLCSSKNREKYITFSTKKLSNTIVFNIDNNKKCFLRSKSALINELISHCNNISQYCSFYGSLGEHNYGSLFPPQKNNNKKNNKGNGDSFISQF